MITNLAPPEPIIRRSPERANVAPGPRLFLTGTLAGARTPADNATYVGPPAVIGADFVDDTPGLTPTRDCAACGGPFQDQVPYPGRPWTLCTFCRRPRTLPALGDQARAAGGQEADERQVRGPGRARQARDRVGAPGSGDRADPTQERRCWDCRRSLAGRHANARRCERCAVVAARLAANDRVRRQREGR